MSGEDARPFGQPENNTPLRPVVKLTAEWATAVAREFIDVVRDAQEKNLDPPSIDECWVGQDLAIYIRYRIGTWKLGRRIPDSHIDPTSGGYALGEQKQAFYYLYDLHSPPPRAWADRLGYEWYGFGPQPYPTWAYAVEELPRIATARTLNVSEEGGQ